MSTPDTGGRGGGCGPGVALIVGAGRAVRRPGESPTGPSIGALLHIGLYSTPGLVRTGKGRVNAKDDTVGQTMRAITVAAALLMLAPPGAAVADGDTGTGGGTVLPFAQVMRRCDYSETEFNGPTGSAMVTGVLRSDGTTVTAEVQLAVGPPNTRYDVRLIQAPRSSNAPCWGGDPGVAVATLHTDGAGAGAVTVHDTIEPWATGAWVYVTRPSAFSQDPAEFYSTDLIVRI